MKYQAFLSRRKFKLIYKTQSSAFNAEQDVWLPRNIKCVGVNISVPSIVSVEKVDKFVKSLDISHISEIPNFSGVSRTVTGPVFMILDLHLCLAYLRERLIWFNENIYHFIIKFSDDGAPETSDLGMSIGSLTVWNFGDKVRSRPVEPVHNEINAWQHLLNVMYQEALRRGLIETFLEILSLPLQTSDNNQVRQSVSSTLPHHAEGAGDRAKQSELLQEKHKVFQEAIGRARTSHSVEVT